MIEGGYYIKARKIQESTIQHSPPHFREIWDWLLMTANHKPKKVSGRIIERGQVFCTYGDIQEGLHWRIGARKMMYSKSQIESAFKAYKRTTMVTVAKTTRGITVTLLNYDYYQNPKNYENHTENHDGADSGTTVKPHYTQELKKEEGINKVSSIPYSSSASKEPDDKTPEKPKRPKPKIPPCPHSKIVDLYHETLPELSQVRKITPEMQTHLRARWKEYEERQNLDWWKNYFIFIGQSKFLMGKIKDEFQADLHWIIGSKNMSKILNGRYHRQRGGRQVGIQEWLKIKMTEDSD